MTGKNPTGAPQTLLPLLLSIAGKAVKIPLGEGDEIFISLIRLLGAITSNCDAAARQCFEDPSNFFLMDLASVGSDSLGVSSKIQTSVCFFLGNCFAALQDPISTSTSSSTEGSSTQDSTLLLNKKSFLTVIDTRIGLTRFNELLRRPLKVAHTTNNDNDANTDDVVDITKPENQVDDIVVEEEQDIKYGEEACKQRQALYKIIIPATSPHGVPSLLKTLDAAVLFLKIARSIDTRLQNISEIDDFFDYLMQVEQDMVRIAKQGFGTLKVLIIEGLLSSGKSTLINGLKSITRASTIEGVPANLLEVKYLFNSAEVPEAVTTALDCVINYCIAHKVILDAQSKPEGRCIDSSFFLFPV